MDDDKKKDNDKDQEPSINVSIGGNVSGDASIAGRDIRKTTIGEVAGDYVEGNKVIQGDEVHGNKVTIGSIQLNTIFEPVREALHEAELADNAKQEAAVVIDELEREASEESPDQAKLDRWLSLLEEVAPTILELLINLVTNPGAAAGAGLRVAVKAFKARKKSG